MQLSDALYNDLVDYLARRPWIETNKLITRIAIEKQVSDEKDGTKEKVKVDKPAPVAERR